MHRVTEKEFRKLDADLEELAARTRRLRARAVQHHQEEIELFVTHWMITPCQVMV